MDIEKIMPFYNNDGNSDDDDDGEEEEEEDGDQVHYNFFTEENLCSLKFPTGDEFFTFLQSNAYSEGFKLVSEHSHNDTFIYIKCYQHNTKSPAYEKCNFKINLQAHNFNSNIKQYLGTRSLILSEMRNVITSADRRRSMNRHYIKARKIKKSFGSEILIFMELLKVDKRIAEALNGSLNKCNVLIVTDVDDIWKVTETKQMILFM
ncbi:hypothetical protein M9Y10_007310 [Tritrichomonas musculus]|uniref:Uncharacterized protein n=1 Tax=Tritrichomonas musculus TaxID=1915356 RepID=A0ABR2J1T9_9EUKA